MKYLIPGIVLIVTASMLPADQIPIGLSWKEIFVQEYWKDGEPYYAIANLGKKEVLVTTADGGKWKVGAGAVVKRKTTAGKAEDYVRFYANGVSLGLLFVPQTPKQPVKDKIATYDGLNGSGGRYQDLYCVQDQTTFRGGQTIEIQLIIPTGRGTVTFPKAKRHDYPLTEVFIKEIKCDTLPVTDNGKEIVINADQPIKNQPVHTATLRFPAPKVTRTTMVMFDGFSRKGQGGHGITRGVIVTPGPKGE